MSFVAARDISLFLTDRYDPVLLKHVQTLKDFQKRLSDAGWTAKSCPTSRGPKDVLLNL